MIQNHSYRPSLEILEARIAPAAVATLPTIKDAEKAYDANPFGDDHFIFAATNTPLLLHAGQVLTTGVGARSGNYLLFVEKGQLEVFTTDLNLNGQIDYNEITGIAAGDGVRFTSFVDIHGDIVTNLNADGYLSDSDRDSSNNPVTRGDGKILNNSRIEAITLRGLAPTDLTDQNNDGIVDATDVSLRLSLSSYSIFGQVLAGKGFGVPGDATSGLFIDDTGKADQLAAYDIGGANYYVDFKPTVGAIRTGSAASGEYFAFGYSRAVDIQGHLGTFTAPTGQVGGDIAHVSSKNVFNFSGLYAGMGGAGARGGDISDVTANGDNASGYNLVAGNGGRGVTGGGGGSILNFTDLGSVTGKVLISTGNGGQGTNGVGGNGGTLGLGTTPTVTGDGLSEVANINVNAGLTINLGDGGTGFRGGGAGASLTNAVIRAPEGEVPFAQAIVGTTHDAFDPVTGQKITGIIGRSQSFDFDGDGFNDLVYSTSSPEQVVVALGDGTGAFRERIYLDAPDTSSAIAVADLNNDGHPDVIVASSKSGDFSGITVFMNQYAPQYVNGVVTGQVFSGFASPRISPLPSLNSGDSANPGAATFIYARSSNPVTDLVVGDFGDFGHLDVQPSADANGDGITDIAVSVSYVTQGAPNNRFVAQVVLVLTADTEINDLGVLEPTGHYYADFGTKAVNGNPASPLLPFEFLGLGNAGVLESTALSTFSNHDVILGATVVSDKALRDIHTPDVFAKVTYLTTLDFAYTIFGQPLIAGLPNFQSVDTNRKQGEVALADANIREFAIIDFNQDGLADYLGVTETPENFVVGLRGNGSGSGTIFLGALGGGDQAGLPFTGGATKLVDIVGSVPTTGSSPQGTTSMRGISVLDVRISPVVYNILPNADSSATTLTNIPYFSYLTSDESVVAIDSYRPNTVPTLPNLTADPSTPTFRFLDTTVIATPSKTYATGNRLEVVGALTRGPNILGKPSYLFPDTFSSTDPTQLLFGYEEILGDQYITVNAGNGGNGIIGRGGNGGIIGTGKLVANVDRLEGGFDFTYPTNPSFEGEITLQAGNGGNGFSVGGNGGLVTGVAIRLSTSPTVLTGVVNLFGGNGGTGNSGAGGAGGSLISNSLVLAQLQQAGNGGTGKTGGAGGSILGHGFVGFADNTEPEQTLLAGNGAAGVKAGGAGGSILNYHGQFSIPFFGTTGGLLQMTAGFGGDAVSGRGGSGGNVTNVSPFSGGIADPGANLLAGDINIQGGFGGNGTEGGSGGTVNGFVNRQSGDTPGILTFIGGNGGNGVRGNGGIGGSVLNVETSSTGSHRLDTPFPTSFAYSYNHIIAGAGGSSSAASGGAGGSIINIATTGSDGPFAVAAGAGGDGLKFGGAGGSVQTVGLAVGGTTSKGLVVAGDGGSAGAFVIDPGGSGRAFGGKIGVGGNGGSIIGFMQTGATGAHLDLIAGNGGDSVNFSGVVDSRAAKVVGKGGSILNVSVAGTLGNTDASKPIRSYNNIAGGQSMADFVQSNLRDPLFEGVIDDSVGNVGLVVGGAGRLKAVFTGYDSSNQATFRTVAAFNASNGSLIGVKAREIMSAVAGNVEQIATIKIARDIFDIQDLTRAPIVGTDKTPTSTVEFLDPSGLTIPSPVTDGALIDGALIVGTKPTQTVRLPSGGTVFNVVTIPGHTYVLT